MASNETSSYLPPGESPGDLYIEHTNFASAVIGSFLYGAHFILVLIALHFFLHGKPWRNVEWGMLTYTVLLFTGSTLYMTANVKWASQMFIDYRNYPGGPVGFYINAYNTPMIVFGNAAFIFNNSLADGLLLYRTWVVWGRNWRVVCFPILVYLGSTTMSIMTVCQLARPGSQFFSKIGLALALPYFSLSIALNLLLTLMIVTKLLVMRRRLHKLLGPEHARMYTGVAAMLVESASLYAVFSILFIATYSVNDSLFNVCLPIQAQAMCIAPLLIIIRVARGRAFSEEAISATVTSKISFARGKPQPKTAGTEESKGMDAMTMSAPRKGDDIYDSTTRIGEV